MQIELNEIEIATLEDGLRALEAEYANECGQDVVHSVETTFVNGQTRAFTLLRAKLAGLKVG